MTHSIEGQKTKHINLKFEDAGCKCQFYQRLDSMLDAAPAGLLRVNRGADANRLNDLLTFMSFGMHSIWDAETFKFQGTRVEGACKGAECSIQGGSEPLEYCWAPQKWSTC